MQLFVYNTFRFDTTKKNKGKKTQTSNNIKHNPETLDTVFSGCESFYIDMGTNIGVQIRKLFQPEYYPGAPVLPIFDRFFGDISTRRIQKNICAVGFEMNPKHSTRLESLSTKYNECGFKTKIYTETAVTTYDGNISFWTDNNVNMMEWGASTVYQWIGQNPLQVRAVNIERFLKTYVLPHAKIIVAKLDIEGEEKNVLPHLLASGILCKFDYLFLETHERMFAPNDLREFVNFKSKMNDILVNQQCKVEITDLDDESYLKDEDNSLDSCKKPKPNSIVDMGLYINLQHRTDRRQSIENQLKDMQFDYEIINAINPRSNEYKHLIENCFDERTCPGQVGCQHSHLLALNLSMKRGYKAVAIFEDDFVLQSFVDPTSVQAFLRETTRLVPDWDVIALSLSVYSENPLGLFVNFSSTYQAQLTQITGAQTTGGYILRDTIIPSVYQSFLNCDVKKDYHTAIDQCWKHLQYQSQYKWIAFEPQPGTQAKSYSDIERHDVDYGLSR